MPRDGKKAVVALLGLGAFVTAIVLATRKVAVPPAQPPPPGLSNLYGVVIDASTGALIQGAQVILWVKDGTVTTFTHDNGYYIIEGVGIGSHDIWFDKEGYWLTCENIVLVEGNNEFNVQMEPVW